MNEMAQDLVGTRLRGPNHEEGFVRALVRSGDFWIALVQRTDPGGEDRLESWNLSRLQPVQVVVLRTTTHTQGRRR